MSNKTETTRPAILASPGAVPAPLWTIRDAAAYLRKSVRWIQYALRLPEAQAGSIPHIYIGRNARFFPDDVMTWARWGCPSVSDFKTWKENEKKRK